MKSRTILLPPLCLPVLFLAVQTDRPHRAAAHCDIPLLRHTMPQKSNINKTLCWFIEEIHSVHVTLSAGGKQRHIFKVWESLKLFLFCFTLDCKEVNIGQSEIGCAVSNLQVCRTQYLLHTCVATHQLLPEVGDVMVVLLQVLLEVVAPERQQGFFYLGVEL